MKLVNLELLTSVEKRHILSNARANCRQYLNHTIRLSNAFSLAKYYFTCCPVLEVQIQRDGWFLSMNE